VIKSVILGHRCASERSKMQLKNLKKPEIVVIGESLIKPAFVLATGGQAVASES
jgi:hypothetical protein